MDVLEERFRQFEKFGDQSHLPLGFGRREALANVGCAVDIAYQAESGSLCHLFAGYLRERVEQAGEHLTYEAILTEEYAELLAESEPGRVREELVQLAAVAVQIIEAIDRKASA